MSEHRRGEGQDLGKFMEVLVELTDSYIVWNRCSYELVEYS